MPRELLPTILSYFDIPVGNYDITPIGHGLINKSYVVTEATTHENKYFLQQIDHNIFKDIPGLMQNIAVVTAYFKTLDNPPQHLRTYSTKTGQNYYHSATGEYIRLYNYVNGYTYHRAENLPMASESGRMFGEFLNALSGLDSSLLTPTIPHFHDINIRYAQFLESIASAGQERTTAAAALIQLVHDNIQFVKEIYHELVETCPLRATHNDCKLSNLLFDKNLHGICVIDYDTLMPGYWPLDFADSVRTLCSSTLEDDKNIANTRFDIGFFKAFATSFVNTLDGTITASEINLLPKAVPYMPFLMGLRMLTDYLNNDIYYSTQYPDHNYYRAANQLTLYKSGSVLQDEMNNIVKNILYDPLKK